MSKSSKYASQKVAVSMTSEAKAALDEIVVLVTIAHHKRFTISEALTQAVQDLTVKRPARPPIEDDPWL